MTKPVFGRRKPPIGRRKDVGRIQPVTVKRLTGYDSGEWRTAIPRLRENRYVLDRRSVGGDAPKDFVRIYGYEGPAVLRDHWRTWPAHIAKVGHQYYPGESATEHLLTRVGQICGLNVAESKLMICAGQLRFLSRYFLGEEEILNHAADILGRHLADQDFVLSIAADRIEKDIFTFQVYRAAIESIFPEQAHEILRGFVRMIGFDALVGNQDRHIYNWGVITHIRGSNPPRLAPVYDTARGLFWNANEAGLRRYQSAQGLTKYIEKSTPQIGWDSHSGHLNHFDLVERVACEDDHCWAWLEELANQAEGTVSECQGMVDAEFESLLSPTRRKLIKRCLEQRFDRFAGIFRG